MDNKMNTRMSILRKGILAALSLVVVAGGILLVKGDAEAALLVTGDAQAAPHRPAPDTGADDDLRARIALYTDLRKANDWDTLYDMVDPAQRAKVDKGRFLSLYGQGVLKTNSIELLGLEIDYETLDAVAQVETEAELVIAKLPAHVRASLQVPSREELVRTTEHLLLWTWEEGDWYFCLDDAIERGKDDQGRTITPVVPTSKPR